MNSENISCTCKVKVKQHNMKAYRETKRKTLILRKQIELSGQLHASSAFVPGIRLPIPILFWGSIGLRTGLKRVIKKQSQSPYCFLNLGHQNRNQWISISAEIQFICHMPLWTDLHWNFTSTFPPFLELALTSSPRPFPFFSIYNGPVVRQLGGGGVDVPPTQI